MAAICDNLSISTNGAVSYNPPTTPRLEGTVATYGCVTGYELSPAANRTCGSNRQWSGSAPSSMCERELIFSVTEVS